MDNNDGTYTITTLRDLECMIPNTYVVQLDKALTFITAWDATSPTMVYHGANKKSFPRTYFSDGTCTAYVPPTPTDVTCT